MATKMTRAEKLEKIAELEDWIGALIKKVGRRRGERADSVNAKITEAQDKIKLLQA